MQSSSLPRPVFDRSISQVPINDDYVSVRVRKDALDTDVVPLAESKESKSISGSTLNASIPVSKDDYKLVTGSSVRVMRASVAGKKPVAITLVHDVNNAGSFNTLYNTVFPLQVGGTTEFSSVQALWDEIKVKSIDVDIFPSTLSTADPGGGTMLGVIAYDPCNSGTFSSPITASESEQHKVVVLHPSFPAGANSYWPGEGAGKDHLKWHIRVKSGTQTNPTISNEVATGLWHATTDANAIDGYLKPAFEAFTATRIGFRLFVRYNCLVRQRT